MIKLRELFHGRAVRSRANQAHNFDRKIVWNRAAGLYILQQSLRCTYTSLDFDFFISLGSLCLRNFSDYQARCDPWLFLVALLIPDSEALSPLA